MTTNDTTTVRPASPLTVTEDSSGGFSIVGEDNVRAFAELMILRALDFEVRTGMKLSRGPSAYATVKARYGFRGNKHSVLIQLRADMHARGFNLPPSPLAS
jgi:hypothetical protein